MTNNTEPLKVGELKPCPFCGGTEQFVERADYSGCYVQCDCNVRGPIGVQCCDDEEMPGRAEAVELWNRRTEPSPADVTRYGCTTGGMEEQEDGDYVLYCDYRQALSQQSPARVEGELTDALRYEISDIIESLRDYKLDQAQAEQAIFRAIERALNQRLAVKEGEAVGQITVEYISADSDDKKLTAMTWSEAAIPAGTHDIYIAPLSTHPVSDDRQAKDAARYRWLRSRSSRTLPSGGVRYHEIHHGTLVGETLDAAIDAALSTTKQEESK